jgi:hypothetical protein
MQEGKKPQQHGDPGSEGTRTAPTAGQGDQQTKVGSQGHRPDEPDDDGATRGETGVPDVVPVEAGENDPGKPLSDVKKNSS